MHISALRARLRELGALPQHEERVLRRWAMAQPQEGGRRRLEDFLPRALRAELASLTDELAGLARLHSQHAGEDGSARLLLTLRDGQQVESVLLPPDRPRRVLLPARGGAVDAVAHSASPATARTAGGGLCVSTQVGCAVGCVFCMTGQGGLQRQLGSAEIVAQVVLARGLRPVNKVVLMGMGEPAHNLDAAMEAIALLGTAGGIGHKNLVFSTVGDPRVFERLQALGAGEVKPALALSLHTSKPGLRAELLPRAPRFDPADLVAAGESYARHSGYPIQYQWTLIEGVNDGDEEVDGIVRLLSGKYALMNLIPYNAVAGLPWRRPAAEPAAEMARALHRRGILAKLRQSAGQDVDAGCGQLRVRAGGAAGLKTVHITPA